jgi:YHS domain-containing protein
MLTWSGIAREAAMTSVERLYLNTSALVLASEAREEARVRERAHRMERIETRLARFDALATRWMEDAVRPRLEVLRRLFGHATPVEVLRGGHGLALSFAYNEEFPAHARLEVCLSHDPECTTAWCTFSPSIIPILMDYERDTSIDVRLEAPDLARLEEFIDARIERFVRAYLGLREPESMYQRDLRVHDPVCGMTFRRIDAHAHLDHGGRRVFFCSDACRKRFEADPLGYGPRPTAPGAPPSAEGHAAVVMARGGRS